VNRVVSAPIQRGFHGSERSDHSQMLFDGANAEPASSLNVDERSCAPRGETAYSRLMAVADKDPISAEAAHHTFPVETAPCRGTL